MKIFCDFHIHSDLSPCAEADMTPGNIAGMAMLNGLQAIALTDHQSCGNCAAAIALSENDLFVRVAALLKSQEIPIFAVGRGPELEKASEAYVLFLRELARGTKAARLADLLDDADAKLELAFEAAQENFKQ